MNNKYRVWCLRNNCWHPGEGNVPTYYDAALAFSEQVADTEVREYPTPPAKVEGEWKVDYHRQAYDRHYYCVTNGTVTYHDLDRGDAEGLRDRLNTATTLAAENARLREALELVLRRGHIVQQSDQYMNEVLHAARTALAGGAQ
jgi:hypothetical protein